MAGRNVIDTLTFWMRVRGGQAAAGAINQVGKAAEKTSDKMSDLEKKQRMQAAAGAKMVAAGVLVAGGLAKAADATARLAVAQDTTNQVFGEASDVIGNYADDSVEKLGLSERAYREASSQLGAFLKNLGFDLPQAAAESNRLLEVSADLAAAFGRSTGEAANAISAVLRKEFDTIERFGVAIKQIDIDARVAALGLDTSTAAALKNSEAVAALSLVYEQAEQFAGKFQSAENKLFREQQQLGAEFENVRAELGEAFLPVLEQAVSLAGRLATGFGDLNEKTGGVAGKILALSSGFLTLGGGMLVANRQIAKIGQVMGLSEAAAGKLAGRMVALTAAVSAGILVWDVFQRDQQEIEMGINSMVDAIKDAGSPLEGLTARLRALVEESPQFASIFGDLGPGKLEEFAEAVADTTNSGEDLTRMLLEWGVGYRDAQDVIEQTADRFNAAKDRIDDQTSALGENVDAWVAWANQFNNAPQFLRNTGAATLENRDAWVAWAQAMNDADRPTAKMVNNILEAAPAFGELGLQTAAAVNPAKRLARAFGEINTELDEFVTDFFFDAEERDFEAALDRYFEALKESKGSFDSASDSGREAQETFESAALAGAKLLTDLALEGELTPFAFAARWAEVESTLTDSLSPEAAEPLLEKLDLLRQEVELKISDAALVSMDSRLQAWRSRWVAMFSGIFSPEAFGGLPTLPGTPGLDLRGLDATPVATGGPVGPGRTYLVGERGPELVRFGQRGFVTPNHMINGAGGPMVVNVEVDGRQLLEVILEQNSRAGKVLAENG